MLKNSSLQTTDSKTLIFCALLSVLCVLFSPGIGRTGPATIEITPLGNVGAATTNISIDVPLGRKDIAPKLSLNYNSQKGNGWVGLGWSLEMGEIMKSGKSGIDYTFILSGGTTDLKGRSEWGTNYYGAKTEGAFSKYYHDTSTDSWKVTTKDGTKYYFGSSIASRQSNDNGTYRWFLDRVEDINGNYMTISYITDQGEIYLDRIDYTGAVSPALSPTNYVKFILEPRNDAITKYNIGSEVITASRLRTIEVYGNGQLARKYVLEYTYSPNSSYSLLSSVTLYGSDGVTALPPITFSYQTTENSFQFISSQSNPYPQTIGDFNGDGKADYYANGKVFLSDGSSFTDAGMWLEYYSYYSPKAKAFAGDVNGDGKDDLIIFDIQVGPLCFQQPIPRLVKTVQISTGNSFQRVNSFTEWLYCYASTIPPVTIGDFNGDGKADYDINGSGAICYSNGSGFICIPGVVPAGTAVYAGDVNADGKDDLIIGDSSQISLYFSKGNSYFQFMSSESSSDYPVTAGNFNGDDKVDYIKSSGSVCYSNGGSFNCVQGIAPTGTAVYAGDVNADGKDDLIIGDSSLVSIYTSTGPIPSLLSSIDNGFGGTTTITYAPSSQYTNTYLPYVVQTLSSVTVGDGNGNSSTTIYEYSGGLFDYEDREFRGFQYVRATAPNDTYTETWFYTDDDIFKGLAYEQITSDSSGNIYIRAVSTYNSTPPFTGVNFPFLQRKDDYAYDGTATPKQARAEFTYDSYGNVTRRYFYGDISVTGDEKDEYITYYYDTANWILSLPQTIYVKDSSGNIKSQTWFTYYSGTVNLKTAQNWLNTGTNPVTTYTYDAYGNLATVKDPKQNPVSTVTYDTATYTYPWKSTNSLGQTTERTYDYRFGKMLTEKNPNGNTTTTEYDEFGRIKKVTSPNDTGSTYGTMSYFYLNFGTVGSQRVVTYVTEQTGTGNYIWTETYFDGLGRTIKTRAEGTAGKVIATETTYNQRGLKYAEALPYFEGIEAPRWMTHQYDPIGRIIRTDYPDGTYATSSYLRGTLTYIDANRHQKVEVKDIYGRIIEMKEYTGTSPSVTLYSTTTYGYDVMGNITNIRDEAGNQTSINYNSLSQKTAMSDPDMQSTTYDYDANGNLTYQKDAKNQAITFQYDAINREIKKIYPDGSYIEYRYDETFSSNSKGRLTTVTDFSGTTKYYYDKLGRTIKTEKIISSNLYTTQTTYDSMGRIDTITYPDNTVIKYEYDSGGNLYQIKDLSGSPLYATFSNYNAAGQAKTINYGNGVTTQYQFYAQNNRLSSITTTSPDASGLMNLSYQYDSIGNITKITDSLDSSKTRDYVYDALNRLTEANSPSYGGNLIYQYDTIGNMTYNCRYGFYYYEDPKHKHAVTRIEKNGTTIENYSYDDNGNMLSGAGRTFTYDYDNRATSITYGGSATISVYDADGNRVKKQTPTSTTTYIGQIYECTGGNCTKYIFAGSQRIADIKSTGTYYHHTDHLGSATVITNSSGNIAQEIYYYPFGEIKTNTGSIDVKHKFTDQEFDAETGLYYFGARYYDPKLARFVTADSIIPYLFYPQSLNRYSYAANNPLLMRDANGHWFWVAVIVGAVIGGVSAAISGGGLDDILRGMLIGAISGAVGYGAGLLAGNFATSALCATRTVAAVIGGAAGGMAAGGISAALTGGDIGQGMLIGAVSGAVGGYIGAQSFTSDFTEGLAQLGAGAVVGGTMSELTGGKFWEGFKMGAISGIVAFATNKMMEGLEFSRRVGKPLNKYMEEILPDKYKAAKAGNYEPLTQDDWALINEKFNTLVKDCGSVCAKVVSQEHFRWDSASSKFSQVQTIRADNFHIHNLSGPTKSYSGKAGAYIHFDNHNPILAPTPHIVWDLLFGGF